MTLDWRNCAAVESVPDRLSGAWIFHGTRIPVSALFENLGDGLTVQDIAALDDGLTIEHIDGVLELVSRCALECLVCQHLRKKLEARPGRRANPG